MAPQNEVSRPWVIQIVFPDPDKLTHGGTWDARYKQAAGELTAEEADRLVQACRLNRRRTRAASRRQPVEEP